MSVAVFTSKHTLTTLFRLIVQTEELLKEGLFLDQMHFTCIQALEDTKQTPKVKQCFNCQQLGDHLSSECKKPTKCVLCAGPHRKAECTKTKEEHHCANCGENHAAWSTFCSHRIKESNQRQKPTMAQVASATVTPTFLNEILDQVKQHIAMVVAEVVARCLCELTMDIVDRKVSKMNLPMKVGLVCSHAVKAVNKATYGTKPVELTLVKDSIIKKCFPAAAPTATAPAATASEGQNQNDPTSRHNV